MGRQYLPKRSTYTVLSAMGYFLDGYDLSVISVFTYALLQYKFAYEESCDLGKDEFRRAIAGLFFLHV